MKPYKEYKLWSLHKYHIIIMYDSFTRHVNRSRYVLKLLNIFYS